jgi:ribonuclease HI
VLISTGFLEPIDAEALVALEATQLCYKLGYGWISFVGDAKSVVDVVTSEEQDWSRKGRITDAIRSHVRAFSHWTFTHTSKEANQVAHELARLVTK